ncbi:MAG: hypothetical protein HYT28_00085 [Parcubacteria group bacterium]|nr:hypothetical protein [Parcubacteria group bacterium]
MRWIKKGLIFKTADYRHLEWMEGRAWVPTVEYLGEDLFKVYFGGLNAKKRSQTGFFVFNIKNPAHTLEVSEKPIIELGPLGAFDERLAIACSFAEYQGSKFIYYVGWQGTADIRYLPSIGLATSTDGGETFTKYSRAPVFERTDDEPFGRASPFVMYDKGIFRMWYASYRYWEMRGNESWPHYEIRSAQSQDGIHWKSDNVTCLGSDKEEAVARPYVLKEHVVYKMWYSYRQNYGSYRIGYAESLDGIRWERMDERVGIDVSESGFDSEMIDYPCVFDHEGERYMLYNGNGFGRDGIGLAQLEE